VKSCIAGARSAISQGEPFGNDLESERSTEDLTEFSKKDNKQPGVQGDLSPCYPVVNLFLRRYGLSIS